MQLFLALGYALSWFVARSMFAVSAADRKSGCAGDRSKSDLVKGQHGCTSGARVRYRFSDKLETSGGPGAYVSPPRSP